MIISRNPYTKEELARFEEFTDKKVEEKLALAKEAFEDWKERSLAARKKLIQNLENLLESGKESLGKLITLEIGRPIKDSISEIEKCAKICRYYLDNIDEILSPEKVISISSAESFITYEPLGPVLAIMPWNFPFSQILRCAIPNILAGNVVLLKHSSNVPQCALAIENLFESVNFPKGVFQNLFISSDKVESIIRDKRIIGVALTGGERAGAAVAKAAGEEIKKTVLELGGSDAFIVLSDADLDLAVDAAVESRLKNAGQACNAAKRFILIKNIADEFVKKLAIKFENLKLGDPMEENTDIGPMASEKGLLEIENQVKESIKRGARILIGGKRLAHAKGYFFEPTILLNVKKGMPAYDEELFGPVASIILADNEEEAIKIANDSRFGLGASIWSKNIDLAKSLGRKIEAGSVFINSPFHSHPALPFGGVKKSGYGREFGSYGVREFLNMKSIFVNN